MNARHALKVAAADRSIFDHYALGSLVPAERRALSAIIEHADLIEVDGCPPHLLVTVTPELIDVLALVGSEAADLEPDDPAEDDDQDDEYDDREHELAGFGNPQFEIGDAT